MWNFLSASLSPTSVILAAVVLMVVTLIKFLDLSLRSSGPWGLPFLGYYPFLRKDFAAQLMELSKKYGDAYVINIAGKTYLHLGSIKALREAFVTKADCFGGRSQEFSLFYHLFKDGLFMVNDDSWRTWRKFVGQAMRELGIGPGEKLKGPILNALEETLDTLAKSEEQPVDFFKLLSTQCVEIVRRLVLGDNVSKENALKMSEVYGNSMEAAVDMGLLLHGNFAKWFLLPRYKGYKEIIICRKELVQAYYKILEDHKANFDPQHCNDFIDLYLREKELKQKKNDPQAQHFTDKAFISTVMIVFGDGSVSIAGMVVMYLRMLARKLDVQNEIYEEIVSEIGTNRLPTYDDRTKLLYTYSVIKELERTLDFASVIPSVVTKRDTVISGTFVPKGAITLINFPSMHSDPRAFKDPSCFDPKRFIPDDKNTRSKADMPVLFSLGKRACAGEGLAMTEIFVFIASILQQYSLHPTEETEKSSVDSNQDELQIFLCNLIAKPRNPTS